ncbi:MFS transporter [Paramuribaculum intestinale]|uniref:MFS transporter n=1 Tax=Paramuribaculum intestinale TaxID=2094151 RepID=UPI0025B67FC3|nr:MFS transporter [Paramuribaculum intestinale]
MSDDKLWNREYWKVMTSNFMLFFAFYILTPLLPIYLDAQFAADKHMIGIVLSGYVVATLLVRPFSGFIVDTFDRKRVLTLCFFVFFIMFAGYVGAGTLLMFAIVRTLHGLPFGAATVANSTVAIDVLPASRRNEGIGYYGLSNNLAMAIAPSVGIWIYHATGRFDLLFWLALVIALAGFVSSSRVRLPERRRVIGRPKLSLDHFFLGRAWLMAVNICLFGLCWGVMSNYVAIYGQGELGITDGTGLFFMILAVGLVCARLIGSRSLRRGEIARSGLRGVIFSSLGFLLFAAGAGEWGYYLSALLIGLGNGQMYPAMLNMFIGVARHDQRGTANSSILISWDAGMGLGILFGGFLAQYMSYAAAFGVTALAQLVGALLYGVATCRFFERRRLSPAVGEGDGQKRQ